MKIRSKFLSALAVCSLSVAPLALAGTALAHPGTTHPATPSTVQTRAYGKFCQSESKKHVSGQKGTPFSQCVTAMAKLAHGTTKSPSKACTALSKKHIAGTKSTPYSLCVSGGAKLLKSQHNS